MLAFELIFSFYWFFLFPFFSIFIIIIICHLICSAGKQFTKILYHDFINRNYSNILSSEAHEQSPTLVVSD